MKNPTIAIDNFGLQEIEDLSRYQKILYPSKSLCGIREEICRSYGFSYHSFRNSANQKISRNLSDKRIDNIFTHTKIFGKKPTKFETYIPNSSEYTPWPNIFIGSGFSLLEKSPSIYEKRKIRAEFIDFYYYGFSFRYKNEHAILIEIINEMKGLKAGETITFNLNKFILKYPNLNFDKKLILRIIYKLQKSKINIDEIDIPMIEYFKIEEEGEYCEIALNSKFGYLYSTIFINGIYF